MEFSLFEIIRAPTTGFPVDLHTDLETKHDDPHRTHVLRTEEPISHDGNFKKKSRAVVEQRGWGVQNRNYLRCRRWEDPSAGP